MAAASDDAPDPADGGAGGAPFAPREALGAWAEHFAACYGDDLPLRTKLPERTYVLPAAAPATAPADRAGREARSPAPAPARPPATPSATPRRTPPGPRAPSPSAPTPAAAATDAPPVATAALAAEAPDLAALRATCLTCRACKLCDGRTQVVFGEGDANADVMFVGEAPGGAEDRTGRPFVGPAGQLLTRIIENAMGVARSSVFIANVNKCRPPGNRDPEPDEVGACLPWLRRQVEFVQPKVLVALGRIAANNLLGHVEPRPMRQLRGATLEVEGVPLVATWHPAYLLRNEAAKGETWQDIKRVNRLLGRPEVPPPWRGR
jgi:uracil-DNA glycosylase family 4